MLGKVRQHQIVADRRDLIQARLAELALHIVLVDKAIAAVGVETGVRGGPASFAAAFSDCEAVRERLTRIRLRTGVLFAACCSL